MQFKIDNRDGTVYRIYSGVKTVIITNDGAVLEASWKEKLAAVQLREQWEQAQVLPKDWVLQKTIINYYAYYANPDGSRDVDVWSDGSVSGSYSEILRLAKDIPKVIKHLQIVEARKGVVHG